MSIFEPGRALLESISDSEMSELATIARLDEGSGVYGAGSTGYVQTATNVPCRLGTISTRGDDEVLTVVNQVKSVVSHLLSFPLGTNVNATDRVTLGSGRVFEVTGDHSFISTLSMKQVLGKEVT